MDHIYQHSREQALRLAAHLSSQFTQGQGVRFGESAVISTMVHGNDIDHPGQIRIFTDTDAGQHYLKAQEPGQYLHIDIFHQEGALDPLQLGRKIWEGIKEFFQPLQKPSFEHNDQQWSGVYINFAKGILISTANYTGNVYELASARAHPSDHSIENHVHILAQISHQYFDYLINLVEAVETSIILHGYEIRKVERIVHNLSCAEQDQSPTISAPSLLPNSILKYLGHNRKRETLFKLVTSLGTLEEAARFLEVMRPSRNLYLGKFFEKHNDLQQTIKALEGQQLIRKRAFFYTLTAEGQELLGYLREHQKELDTFIKKSIRRRTLVSPQYSCQYNSKLKSKKRRLTDKRKVITPTRAGWVGNIAVSETIIRAATRNLMQGMNQIAVTKEDLRVFGEKSYAPIDICLLVDCSGSMVGEKIRAVSHLAEHLILATREKLCVISFQEMSAHTVVPLTKNYRQLQAGLSEIIPGGLTPLASGIVEAIREIGAAKARNPLLVLITDGMPNYPHWTTDAQSDAISAAKEIARNKIRFVCIGLAPDAEFLQEIVQAGEGNLFVLENLEKHQLVDIVGREWSSYKKSPH